MATRQQDRGEPCSPWNEITPQLWMGGHDWVDAVGRRRPAVVTDQFEVVISLYVRAGHGPAAGVEHHVAEIPDAPLNAGQLDSVRRLAVTAADAVRTGRTTLVRCHAGLNRSGLVVAQALVELGRPCADAIALIRQRRSPSALNNDVFVTYLATGLEIAGLLTELGP
jgi:hypothetical protein